MHNDAKLVKKPVKYINAEQWFKLPKYITQWHICDKVERLSMVDSSERLTTDVMVGSMNHKASAVSDKLKSENIKQW